MVVIAPYEGNQGVLKIIYNILGVGIEGIVLDSTRANVNVNLMELYTVQKPKIINLITLYFSETLYDQRHLYLRSRLRINDTTVEHR